MVARLGLHPRSAGDFLDALVSLHMLDRRAGRYLNTPESDFFLDCAKPSYIGGMLEMANARLYSIWGSLTEGWRTGLPQNEAKKGEDFFGALYADSDRLRGFLQAMTGLSMGTSKAIARKFPYKANLALRPAMGRLPQVPEPRCFGSGPDDRGLEASGVACLELRGRADVSDARLGP